MNLNAKLNSRIVGQWIQQITLTVIICFVYVFTEWVFIVTKPSFLSAFGWGAKMILMLKGSVLFASLAICVLILLYAISLLISVKATRVLLYASSIVPSFVLSTTILLLVDNFTYTVFKFGIVSSSGVGRAAYTFVFLCLLYVTFRFFLLLLSLKVKHMLIKASLAAVLLAAVFLVLPLHAGAAQASSAATASTLPNIIIIGSDGMSADHTSLYGYDRDTTPNLVNFAKDALVVQNAFSNSSNTSASVLSILTGKYPTQTRVFYPPNMLSGRAASEHLPGILKNMGYYTAEFTIPHFADAYSLGMQYGFDEVNGVLASEDSYFGLREFGFSTETAYLFSTMIDRASERLQHILFIRNATNPYDFVTEGKTNISDKDKVAGLLAVFDSHPGQPVFIHAHLDGTHGGTFTPDNPIFSVGETQNAYWMTDFYDDSILTFDGIFGKMVDALKAKGELENTIIVVYSDHGEQWNDKTRVPLIIRFPNGEYKDVKINLAQNLDIPATILDYLKVQRPAWMDGTSLIDPNFKPEPVISSGTMHAVESSAGWVLDLNYMAAPFFQMDYISAMDCQNWVNLNLETNEVTQGVVDHYASPCSRSAQLPVRELLYQLRDHLVNHGYAIPSDLETAIANYR